MSRIDETKETAQGLMQGLMAKAAAVPDSWMPGGEPDPLIRRQHGHIGKPVSRLDGPLKVTGRAPFAAEFAMDGMVYAAVAYSTIAKGRVVEIETRAAEAASGVVLVMTHRNAPKMKPAPIFLSSEKAAGGDGLPVLQDDRICWNGQPVAVVLAATQEAADHAKSLLRIRYAADNALTDFHQAQTRGGVQAKFMGQPLHNANGKAEEPSPKPLQGGCDLHHPPSQSQSDRTSRRHPAWQGDTLRLHDAQQVVAHAAWTLAQVFGLKEEQDCHLALHRRRLRQQDPLAASNPCGGGLQAGWSTGADGAVARRRLPHRRRPVPDRAAGAVRGRRRGQAEGVAPYRFHGQDAA